MIVLPVLQAIDKVLAPMANSMEVKCRNCPHDDVCCNTLVSLTYLEACDIVTYLVQTKQWDLIREKLNAQRQAIMKLGDFRFDEHRNTEQSVVWKWFQRGQKCALYDEEHKRCRVYEVRPLACRELFATHGTDCPGGHSQTTNLAVQHGAELLKLSYVALEGDMKRVCGELATLVWRAFQDWQRAKLYPKKRK